MKHSLTSNRPSEPKPAAQAAPPIPISDLLRQLMLALLTAVLVALPIIGGEDPGLLSDLSGPTGPALTLLLLLGVTAWAGWRMWSRQQAIQISLVEIVLLSLAGWFLVRSSFAGYARPAWFISWVWLGGVLLLFLVRQLATRSGEQQALVAVILAGAVALCAQGAYQRFVTLPADLREAKDRPDRWVDREMARRLLQPSSTETDLLVRRLEKRQVHGPYLDPATLAGILVLFIPVLAGALVAASRGGASPSVTGLAAVAAVLALVILYFTGSLLGFAALIVATLVLGGCLLRRAWSVVLGVLLGVVVLYGVASVKLFDSEQARWAEVWRPTYKMIENRAWLGVGPGQFRFFYPRYSTVEAETNALQPGSWPLEVWADAGLVALVLFLGVLFLVGRQVFRWVVTPHQSADAREPDRVRWEYYLGGMLGLLLTFILRASTLPLEDIPREAIAAALRSVAWFGAFSLFERLPWSPRELVASLGTGLLALFVFLLGTASLTSPAILGSMFVVLGLLLALVQPVPVAWSDWPMARLLPLPILGAVTLCYLAFFLYPVGSSSTLRQRATREGDVYQREQAMSPFDRTIKNPESYLLKRVIEPLEQAELDDPGNVRVRTRLAGWYVLLWTHDPGGPSNGERSHQAVRWAVLARQCCPQGPDGYLAEADVRVHMAEVLTRLRDNVYARQKDSKIPKDEKANYPGIIKRLSNDINQQYKLAAEVLARYIKKAPNDPLLRYRLARSLFESGQKDEARIQARKAQELDDQVPPRRSLSNQQRERLKAILKKETPS